MIESFEGSRQSAHPLLKPSPNEVMRSNIQPQSRRRTYVQRKVRMGTGDGVGERVLEITTPLKPSGSNPLSMFG